MRLDIHDNPITAEFADDLAAVLARQGKVRGLAWTAGGARVQWQACLHSPAGAANADSYQSRHRWLKSLLLGAVLLAAQATLERRMLLTAAI